jgi:hypothetical protein
LASVNGLIRDPTRSYIDHTLRIRILRSFTFIREAQDLTGNPAWETSPKIPCGFLKTDAIAPQIPRFSINNCGGRQ